MSRLTIDVTAEQHKHLEALAALQGKTIGEYAIERLFPTTADDAEQAWLELKSVLGCRIANGLAGSVSPWTISAIVDDELGTGDRA